MYAIYSTPYYDSVKQAYYDILIVEPRPVGKVRALTRQIQLPSLQPSNCLHCQTSLCVYAVKKEFNELMTKEEIPLLMQLLLENEFTVDTKLTKMLLHTGVSPVNKKLICYFKSLHGEA